MKLSYRSTVTACFIGYIVQAIINNYIPLLFITFQNTYNIPLSQITMLVTLNFVFQIMADLISIPIVEKIGYRASAILAHIFSAIGLVALTFLPDILPSPFIGLLISVIIYAVGGGILEVLVSPIVESCPSDNKEKTMSLLHSFYCWGHVGVVLVSTLFFNIFGIENWRILAWVWAMIPAANIFLFANVPIAPLVSEDEEGLSIKQLFKSNIFWLFMLMMLCAGASEQSVSQWASAFAELGLGISKTAGDLAGPLSFAVLMGLSRIFYGKFGDKINLKKFMLISSVLCVISYLTASLSANPVVSLIACAFCGLSVGIMWPGTFSSASAKIPGGGTAMFALLAFAGDLGCSAGPTLVGFVSSLFNDNLKLGILAAVIFPTLLLLCLIFGKLSKSKNH